MRAKLMPTMSYIWPLLQDGPRHQRKLGLDERWRRRQIRSYLQLIRREKGRQDGVPTLQKSREVHRCGSPRIPSAVGIQDSRDVRMRCDQGAPVGCGDVSTDIGCTF